MAKFAYNNVKNASIDHTPFESNCGHYLRVLFKEDVNFYLKSYFTNKLAKKLRELIEICCQNLFYA